MTAEELAFRIAEAERDLAQVRLGLKSWQLQVDKYEAFVAYLKAQKTSE